MRYISTFLEYYYVLFEPNFVEIGCKKCLDISSLPVFADNEISLLDDMLYVPPVRAIIS